MSALPVVVAPEIVFGLTADGFLQHGKELACDAKLRQRIRLAGDEMVGTRIVATPRTPHLHIEDGIVHLAHDALGSREDRRVVVQERQPAMDILPLGCLVGDIAEDRPPPFLPEFDELSEDVFLRDGDHIGLRRSYTAEEIVKGIAVQWVVDQPHDTLRRQVDAYAGKPFPIAIVPKDGGHVLSLFEALLHLLGVVSDEPAAQFLVADAQKFQGFEEIVAEPMVEATLQVHDLRAVLLWKSRGEVAPHYLSAVAHHIVHEHELHVREHVEHSERQKRQCVEKPIYEFRHNRQSFSDASALHVVQTLVISLQSHQLVVGATLHNLSLMEHTDLVGILDR